MSLWRDPQVCWFLLESGYDPDDADTLGNTCLHLGRWVLYREGGGVRGEGSEERGQLASAEI